MDKERARLLAQLASGGSYLERSRREALFR